MAFFPKIPERRSVGDGAAIDPSFFLAQGLDVFRPLSIFVL
jgi:hypothetical protein